MKPPERESVIHPLPAAWGGSDMVIPERHPAAPLPGSLIPTHYPLCFGCGPRVPNGLRMRMRVGEGLRAFGEFDVTEDHQGAPGLVHGGILAAAFDEALGALSWLLAVPAVTGRLETTFRRPVQVGQTLYLDGEIVGVERRKVFVRGLARTGGPGGEVVAEARAVYIQVPLDHFKTHGRRVEVERFAAERRRAPGIPSAEVLDADG